MSLINISAGVFLMFYFGAFTKQVLIPSWPKQCIWLVVNSVD